MLRTLLEQVYGIKCHEQTCLRYEVLILPKAVEPVPKVLKYPYGSVGP